MANPPVCRIMDYGKFRYEEAQKAKESRKKASNVSVKEVKFKPKIGRGDFDVKVRRIDQFIHEGHKVKVTMQFRGREMAHPELGSKILDDVLSVVGGYAKVETQARLEGRNMSMVLAPDRQALDAAKTAETADAAEAAEVTETPAEVTETAEVTEAAQTVEVTETAEAPEAESTQVTEAESTPAGMSADVPADQPAEAEAVED